jgi:PAS domain S-box-containing protein
MNEMAKKRINEIIKTVQQVTDDDYSVRIGLSGKNDEFDQLASSINAMIAHIGNCFTEHMQATTALKSSEERYRKRIDEAMDAIVVADVKTGIIVDCNYIVEELVGRKKSELIGQPQRILHPPQEIEKGLSKTFIQHRETKEGQVLETQVVTKNGEIKDVAIKANIFEFNGKKLMQGIFRDITEYRKLVTDLEREKVLMDAMMNNFPEYIYFKDLDSHFLRISKVLATEVFGLADPKEAIGKSDFDFFPSEHAQKDYDEEQKIIKSGKPVINNEVETEWADGSVSWAAVTKLPLRSEDGQILGTFGISRNITKHRKAEIALEREKVLMDAMMNNFPEYIYFKDLDSHFLRISKVLATEVFGLADPKEAIGKSDFDFFPSEHAQKDYDEEQKIIKSGKPVINNEVKTEWADGSVSWAAVTKMPLCDEHGRTIGTFGVSRNITERKQMGEALEKERELLLTVINNLPDKVYAKDTKGCFIICNNAMALRMGEPDPARLVGKSDFDYIPHELAAGFFADEQEIIKSGKPIIDREEPLDLPSGEVGWNLTTKVPLQNKQGKIIGIVGIGHDITERKRAEAALQYEKSLLDGLMNNIPDSIYFKDRQCRLLKINRRMMESLQMTRDSDYFQKTDVDLFGEEFGRETVNQDLHLMETGDPIIGLIESRKLQDGRLNWTSTTKVPICDIDGEIVGLVGITREINEIKQAEEAREKVIRELQATIEKVNMLKGLIPICANCKKIRDDQGYWSNVESYIANHAEVEFTHGICPECMEKLYPDYVKKKKNGK